MATATYGGSRKSDRWCLRWANGLKEVSEVQTSNEEIELIGRIAVKNAVKQITIQLKSVEGSCCSAHLVLRPRENA